MDWLDLLVVQGTLKNLPQHYSLKASNLGHSDFFKICLQKELVADMVDMIVASFILYYLGPSSQGYGFSSGHVWV